jgi:Zn-dependent alcohol dehydrogenase
VPYLIEQQRKGNFPLEKLITYYEAKDFEVAFEDMRQGKTIKAVLKWT